MAEMEVLLTSFWNSYQTAC